MRIYVCGAHSTGKTTLARHLAEELGIPLLNEVARQVLAERELSLDLLRANMRVVDDYQRAVFERQLEVEAQYDSFVSDRAFDALAYTARHARILPELMSRPETQSYFDRVRDSLVLFVRPQPALLSADGTRERMDWDEVVRIDGMIELLLSWQRIEAVGIGELGLRDRLRTAMTAASWYRKALGRGGLSSPERGSREDRSVRPPEQSWERPGGQGVGQASAGTRAVG